MRIPRYWTDADGETSTESTETDTVFTVETLRELFTLMEAFSRRGADPIVSLNHLSISWEQKDKHIGGSHGQETDGIEAKFKKQRRDRSDMAIHTTGQKAGNRTALCSDDRSGRQVGVPWPKERKR